MADHYGTKVLILLDEYDVPLDKAYINVYYEKMVDFLRGSFGSAFKPIKAYLLLFWQVAWECLRKAYLLAIIISFFGKDSCICENNKQNAFLLSIPLLP